MSMTGGSYVSSSLKIDLRALILRLLLEFSSEIRTRESRKRLQIKSRGFLFLELLLEML